MGLPVGQFQHSLRFTKHTNTWVPFVIASLSMLRPGGRLAMVLPAEILHVLPAQSLRFYIGQHCKKIIIDPEEIWFDGTLQGVVLLLAEKKNNVQEHSVGLGIVQTRGKSFLDKSPCQFFNKTNFINGRTTAVLLEIGFCSGNKECRVLMQPVETVKIKIASSHNVEGSGLWYQPVKHVDIVHPALRNIDNRRDRGPVSGSFHSGMTLFVQAHFIVDKALWML